MEGEEERRNSRTTFRAVVRISHPDIGDVEVHTSEISENGAFILSEGHPMPDMGEVVQVQVQGIGDGDAPIVPMRINYIDKTGVGLKYID